MGRGAGAYLAPLLRRWRRPAASRCAIRGARVWPYYIHTILPHVMRGERVLVSAHGNSLRAMIMALEGLTPDEIATRELDTGVPVVYRLGADTSVIESETLGKPQTNDCRPSRSDATPASQPSIARLRVSPQ